MKTYTIKEQVVSYKKSKENGVVVYKPTRTTVISESLVWTKDAVKMIEMYSGNIAPVGICFDKKNRIQSCRLTFDLDELTTKEILIKKIDRNGR